MSLLKRPFQFGKIVLPSNIFCAPLAGCSDVPFRRMTTSFGPGLVFCEMVKMEPLTRSDPTTLRLLDYDKGMHPIGAQICGSKPELAAPSARIIEDLGFDVLDLNCGCPVDKVTKDGSGSGLLKNPEKIGEILSQMVAAVSIPVTLKIRVGWTDDEIVAEEVTRIAEQAGATAICIHGRTREQAYRGPANWDHIKRCKEAAKNILVIGNGDLFDPLSVEKMFIQTGVDAVLIARGTMGQPWIIEDIYRHFSGEAPIPRTLFDLRTSFLRHLEEIVTYQPERKAVLDLRRVGCWYLKNGPHMRTLRESINRAQSVGEVRTLITTHPWEDGAPWSHVQTP